MSLLDLDALLGQSLATTEAAPDFITPENGVYVQTVTEAKAAKKAVKDAAAAVKEGKPTEYVSLEFTYQINEIVEQEGQPIKPGSLYSERFMLTLLGLPYFKARVRDIAIASGGAAEDVDGLSVGEALAAVKGIQFKTNIKLSKRKVGDNEVTNVRLANIRAADSVE